MNETKSSAQTLLEKLDVSLDNLEKKLGLPSYEPDNEVLRLLSVSRNELEKMTPEQLGEGAYLLRRYALFLQRAFGRESSRLKFLERQIKKTVAHQVSQYRAGSAEERRELAILGDDHCRELAKHRDFSEAKVERLSFLSTSVGAMAHSLEELQQTKRRQRA